MTAPTRSAAAREETAPLVSIVTIFLNAERFLEEAIQSVQAQTYDRWELLLVDDGSGDGSTAIARAHASRDPARVRYLEHPGHANRGMSASRNLGLRHARGDLLGFLDADDVYLPEKLERHSAILRARPEVDLVYGASLYWYDWAGIPASGPRDRVRRRRLPEGATLEPPRLFEHLLRDDARTPTTCGVLMRRELADRVGGFVEAFRGMFEDQAFFFKVAQVARVYVDPGCWDRYRQHPGSACAVAAASGAWDPRGGPSAAQAAFVDWLGEHMRATGVQDAALWRAYGRWAFPYRYPRLHALRRFASRALPFRAAWRRLTSPAGASAGEATP